MYKFDYKAEIWKDITETMNKKRNFYSTIIGTNARGNDE